MNILNENYRAKLKFLAEHAERTGGRVGYEKLFNIKDDNIALFLATHMKLNKQTLNGITQDRFIIDWAYLESITPDKVDEHGLSISFYLPSGTPDSKTFYGKACQTAFNLDRPVENRRKSWPYQELPGDLVDLPKDFVGPEPRMSPEELVMHLYETHGLIMHKTKLIAKLRARREGKDLNEVNTLKRIKLDVSKLGIGSLTEIAKIVNRRLDKYTIGLTYCDKPEWFETLRDNLFIEMRSIKLSHNIQLNQHRFDLLTLFGADIVYDNIENDYDGEQDLGTSRYYTLGTDNMVDLFLEDGFNSNEKCNLRFHTLTPVARVFTTRAKKIEYDCNTYLHDVTFQSHVNGTHLGRLKHYVTMSYNELEKDEQAAIKEFITNIANYRNYHLTITKNKVPEINWHAISISIKHHIGVLISPYTLQYLAVKLKLDIPSVEDILVSPDLLNDSPSVQDTSYQLD